MSESVWGIKKTNKFLGNRLYIFVLSVSVELKNCFNFWCITSLMCDSMYVHALHAKALKDWNWSKIAVTTLIGIKTILFLQAFQNLPQSKNCIKFADIFAKVMHVMCQLGYCTVSRSCFELYEWTNSKQ